jgi:hypothetical protein
MINFKNINVGCYDHLVVDLPQLGHVNSITKIFMD